LDIVNALRARADVFSRFKSTAPNATRNPQYWAEEAANHGALADRLLADAVQEDGQAERALTAVSELADQLP
jgi:hypothetical protein